MAEAYLDHYAATPVLQEVADAMRPYLTDEFGNPSSLHHWGDAARVALDTAREQVAALIGAQPEEIMFVSGGTEANNTAVKGICWAARRKGNHVVVSSIEHFSVLNAARTLGKFDFEMTEVGVDDNGMVDPEEVGAAIRDDTVLVSVMAANGEIGTIQRTADIAAIAREKGVPFHTDAVAAAGYIPLDVAGLGVDAMSIASDLLYGPKGAGALWVRKGLRLMPLLDGGIQEDGRRGGTENMPGIVGMGKAAELAARDIAARAERLSGLRDRLINGLLEAIPRLRLTGHPKARLPWNASFLVEFIEGESMLLFLDQKGIAVSSGSACTSRALKGSHVLTACDVPAEMASGSILFSLGIENTPEEIDYVLETLPPIVERLRQMSPLYAKYLKEGGG
ncbi:MAG TPA: aminotransferase class V-fold PLP-dependent enzyme [Candidatus Anoxymicrobiaceae bacterium]